MSGCSVERHHPASRTCFGSQSTEFVEVLCLVDLIIVIVVKQLSAAAHDAPMSLARVDCSRRPLAVDVRVLWWTVCNDDDVVVVVVAVDVSSLCRRCFVVVVVTPVLPPWPRRSIVGDLLLLLLMLMMTLMLIMLIVIYFRRHSRRVLRAQMIRHLPVCICPLYEYYY